jgi:UDPglucose--hexose-1-phosphate uridylyltransferase
MPEFLIDPLSGDEVLLAPLRDGRPHDVDAAGNDACPFCPGQEAQTPPETAAFWDAAGWRVRAFRNKYAAVEPPLGVHEVIVDSPTHLADFTPESLRMYRDRFAHHAGGAEIDARYVIVFKNAGPKAGASREHPHAQLIALRHVPERVQRGLARAQDYFSSHGSCAVCDEISAAGERAVAQTQHFACYTRPVSRFAYEYRIAPKRHATSLESAADPELDELCGLLETLVSGLRKLHANLSYNLIFESGRRREEASAPFGHWHATLIARTTALAGFELGSGMTINSADPKESAARLRHMVDSHDS